MLSWHSDCGPILEPLVQIHHPVENSHGLNIKYMVWECQTMSFKGL